MRSVDFDALCPIANADFEFRNAARSWNGVVRFDIGADVQAIAFENGEMVEAGPGASFSYDIRIAAPPETWHEMMAPVPRPFYQDLSGA